MVRVSEQEAASCEASHTCLWWLRSDPVETEISVFAPGNRQDQNTHLNGLPDTGSDNMLFLYHLPGKPVRSFSDAADAKIGKN